MGSNPIRCFRNFSWRLSSASVAEWFKAAVPRSVCNLFPYNCTKSVSCRLSWCRLQLLRLLIGWSLVRIQPSPPLWRGSSVGRAACYCYRLVPDNLYDCRILVGLLWCKIQLLRLLESTRTVSTLFPIRRFLS